MGEDLEDRLEGALARLRTERDDLRVRMHLAGSELKQEWEDAEAAWTRLESRLEAAGREARSSSEDVGAALDLLGTEIGRAYERIRARLRG